MHVTVAAHLPPIYTAPPGLVLAAVVIWYWLRLGRADVPASRRRIRRMSLCIILVTIPVLFGAVSLVDSNERASAYVILWSLAILCLGLIVITAMIDALNNMRLLREAARDEALAATVRIMKALKRKKSVNDAGGAERAGDAPHPHHNGAVER